MSPLAASAQHIRLMQSKRDRLTVALLDAENQYLAAVAREWDAGNLTSAELYAQYELISASKLPGIVVRWTRAIGIAPQKVRADADRMPNGDDGSWHGVWPLSRGDSYPPKGVSVVYVLFDEDRTPVYVGSTKTWKERMDHHKTHGKRWSTWLAHPCADREEAYEVESRFLAQYMPALNRQGPQVRTAAR